jgi:putative heme-binding domain-containing protein
LALLTAILDPNLAVEGKFRSYSAVLKDGRVLTGMIVDESASNLVLAASNGMTQSLLRSEIAEISSSGLSFMPEGLERDLKPQDIADVIKFLQADPNSPVTQTSTK